MNEEPASKGNGKEKKKNRKIVNDKCLHLLVARGYDQP